MSEGLSSAFSSLNPFRKASPAQDEGGEEVDNTTIAGGGHSIRARDPLRVSHALKSFLLAEGELSPDDLEDDTEENPSQVLQALADKPHINVPDEVVDRSYPLPEYFISSSHNTYLMAHQLYGTSSAAAYENTLRAGARCVEIDAWDEETDANEPKVTHGYTLVSHIPFRSVCETIRDMVDEEEREAQQQRGAGGGSRPAPVLVSLENHCDVHGQQRLVEIMKEVWGERLLSQAVRAKGHQEQEGGEHVTLEDLGSKIVLIVEYHMQGEKDMSDSSPSDDDDDDDPSKEEEGVDRQALRAYNDKRKVTGAGAIISELAELGVYAQSVKPIDNTWFEAITLKNGPRHHLINMSETGLLSLMPEHTPKIGAHNAHHLMRVYPKGTRISSNNMKPVPFWGLGAQICALNWQTFGLSLQLNEALFAGTDGYVLKPASLRRGGNGSATTGRQKRLRVHVAGATAVPLPDGRTADDIKPYVTATLYHPSDAHASNDAAASKRRTRAYRQHKLGFLHHGENPPRTDPVWDETLEWEYEDSELVFLRILIKSDDAFAVNPVFAISTVRILYAAPGWSFIRMLDLKGRETKCSLLVKFTVVDVE
ncbi:1-phosphatidylinositol-4,5-bisphosphate phosphodiesterase gamma 2 [Cryphonectria parasitica EP155]|uniref:Phosphoinositide phospholipase C n=1 Tax=Cryphonectria parasitica (strain ATCC 38755 / EP155) TaxID=660469 RepID=A0A9P4YEJ6_CRYP1|nr:1-phosphatidylinositol-4,5-bisphosphate phosphodiesterase gamma 2 [Cryphonectria parasitica EP155]KAF3771329.1 1-phosphatidylinositol-4,5-bisphosphate phosphodiesterase gamma 2 [Cryphonectria parasitica EP155]